MASKPDYYFRSITSFLSLYKYSPSDQNHRCRGCIEEVENSMEIVLNSNTRNIPDLLAVPFVKSSSHCLKWTPAGRLL